MTSIHTLIKEGLETKGIWNYYHDDSRGTMLHVSISKETKEDKTTVYIGHISMPDLKYKLESNDLFSLWGTMGDFARVKARQLVEMAGQLSGFPCTGKLSGYDTPSPRQEEPDSQLKLMQLQ